MRPHAPPIQQQQQQQQIRIPNKVAVMRPNNNPVVVQQQIVNNSVATAPQTIPHASNVTPVNSNINVAHATNGIASPALVNNANRGLPLPTHNVKSNSTKDRVKEKQQSFAFK